MVIYDFKTLAECEEHSNLLDIAQNMTMNPSNKFPEKFLFYMFSKYYPFNLTLEFRNKKTIPIRTRINGKLNEVALLEYMANGQSVIIADELLLNREKLKPLVIYCSLKMDLKPTTITITTKN